jgi:hypothetical protein
MQTVARLANKFSNDCSRGLERPFGIARQCFRFCPISDLPTADDFEAVRVVILERRRNLVEEGGKL